MLYGTPQQFAPSLAFSVFVSSKHYVLSKSAQLAAVSIGIDDSGKEKVLWATAKWKRESKRVKLSQIAVAQGRLNTAMKSLDELEHQLNPLSVKEAAMIYGDSASNFYRMIRRGEVPGVFRKTPRARIKICPREFVPWLRKQIAAGCNGSRSAVSKPQLNGKGTYVAEGCTEAWPGLDARTNGKKRGKEDRIA